MKKCKPEESAAFLTTLIINNYSLYKAEDIAVLLEHALRENQAIAEVTEPRRFIFEMCVFTGSWALYECYLEEYLEPITLEMSVDDLDALMIDHFAIAEKLVADLFNNYETVHKGLHYNGAFSGDRPGICSINCEDFEIMDALVENYNKIIGRRDIFRDIYNRAIEN